MINAMINAYELPPMANKLIVPMPKIHKLHLYLQCISFQNTLSSQAQSCHRDQTFHRKRGYVRQTLRFHGQQNRTGTVAFSTEQSILHHDLYISFIAPLY